MRRHGKGPREGIVRAWGSFAKALILKEIWTEEEKRMLEGLGEKGRAQ